MKLVMTLLVRNEEDIVATNIDYHLNRGVDFVIATDNGSEDGTVAILEKYERAGVLQLLHEPQDDYSQFAWVTRMARLAATEHGADWIINNDADEFWWPREGDLKSTLDAIPKDVFVVKADRVNFPPAAEASSPFWRCQTLQEIRSFNSVGQPLPPKVCHRADALVEVKQGNHSVGGGSLEGKPAHDAPMIIYHFPLRTYAQFENKIRLGGAAYERNQVLGKNVGGTWRELYKLYQQGSLEAWFLDQIPDLSDLSSGKLIENIELANFLDRMPAIL